MPASAPLSFFTISNLPPKLAQLTDAGFAIPTVGLGLSSGAVQADKTTKQPSKINDGKNRGRLFPKMLSGVIIFLRKITIGIACPFPNINFIYNP